MVLCNNREGIILGSKIMNILNDKDIDCILMALYHYQLICMGDTRMDGVFNQTQKIIDKITNEMEERK